MSAAPPSGDTVAIGGDALYVSRNNGTAWTRLAFPAAARSSAMYIPNADNVYIGTTDGRIFRTHWTGASWSALTALTTPRANANVSDLFVDPTNLSRMWATHRPSAAGGCFVRTTAARPGPTAPPGLPRCPSMQIQVDPANPNRSGSRPTSASTRVSDGGASWADFSNGLPNMYVGDLVFQPHARVLRAGTRNRGVWEIPVDGWMTQPVCGVQWTGSLAGNETRRWFTHSWPATWHVVWTVMPTTPRPGAPQVTWTVQVERANAEYVTYWITVSNLTPDP